MTPSASASAPAGSMWSLLRVGWLCILYRTLD